MALRPDLSFDPERDANTSRHNIGEATVYINDANAIQTRINEHTNDPLTLERADYKGALLRSQLTVTQRKSADHNFRWIYSGQIGFDSSLVVSELNYFDRLKYFLQGTALVDLHNVYFSNQRLLLSQKTGSLALVTLQTEEGLIHYDNEVQHTGTYKDFYTGLHAPTLREVGARGSHVNRQLASHMVGYVAAVNAASSVLDGSRKIKKILVTSKGPLYPGRRQNTWLRAPIADIVTEADAAVKTTDAAEAPKNEESSAKEAKKIMLDDIGGLKDVRRRLKEVVVSFKNPEVMERWGAQRPQGIILYGPAGTGKTTLAAALANEIDGELWEIKSSEIMNMWLGNSEKNMEKIFEEAKQKDSPTVMLFDEFDALITTSDGSGSGSRAVNAVAGVFKKEMTYLRENNPNIIVVATTNNIEDIDESLIRAGRFDAKFYVELPDDQARNDIFSNRIADMIQQLGSEEFSPFSDDLDIEGLARATEGQSGADIVEVLRRVCLTKAMTQATRNETSPISQSDLLEVIEDIRQS